MGRMKKQANKWRNKSAGDDDFTLPTTDDDRPIDTQEQEELVRSFERSLAQQSLFWRSVFAGLHGCFAAFLLYSIYQQATFPWELRYHAYFMDELHSWIVIAAEWVAVLASSMAITGLLYNSDFRRRWLWSSCYTGVLLAVFWLYNMLKLPKFRWDVIWLPLGPLSGAWFCLYLESLLNESSEDLRKLRGYMYSYKAY